MKRRMFLGAAAALMTLPMAASADEWTVYTPGLIEAELAAGKTVFVDYAATWCSTCARQERVIAELVAENPGYTEAMSFVKVDWDDFGAHEVSTSRSIPRRSTLLVLKGDEELGRIVAGTGKDEIKALMDLGVAASS